MARNKPKAEPQARKELLPRRSPWRWAVAIVCLLAAGFFGLRGMGLVGEAEPRWKAPAGAMVGEAWIQKIEDVDVCQRTVGLNPQFLDAQRTWEEPDPATWKLLRLLAPKLDGSWAKIKMVRGPQWLDEQQPRVGGTVEIHVPECGIHGRAKVVFVGRSPPVQPGEGPVITAVFEHEAAEVIDVHIEGLAEPIGCTPNHPFWSEDRQTFVRADELQQNERLQTLGRTARVTSVVPRDKPERVYNLEVQGEHVYRVTNIGVLVHNAANPCAQATKLAGNTQATELAAKLGREGEAAADIVKNWEHIPSLSGKATYRVPDEMTETTLTEVKNVKYQYFSTQLQDSLHYSIMTERQMILKVRPDTKLSQQLQDVIDAGWIKLEFLK